MLEFQIVVSKLKLYIYIRSDMIWQNAGFFKITVFLVYPELKWCHLLKSIYNVLQRDLDKLTSWTVSVSSFVLLVIIL